MATKKYSDEHLKERLQRAIDRMDKIVNDDEVAESVQVQASNALTNATRRYKEMFGEEPKETQLKSVKNF